MNETCFAPKLSGRRYAQLAFALAAVSLSPALAAQTLVATGTTGVDRQPVQLAASDLDLLALRLHSMAVPTPVAQVQMAETADAEPFFPIYPDLASSSSVPAFGPQQTGSQQDGSQPPLPPNVANHPDQPSKRILGIVPNYRAVAVGAKLPAQSVKEKFVTASQDTFDYSALALAILVAGYDYGTTQTPEFGHGGVGYGRYLWHSFTDQSIENYSVEFIVPALTHEDTRYYTLGSGGFKKRTIYALTRLVVTRTDSGHETVNLGELLGAGLAAGVSNAYYPQAERTAGKTFQNYGTDLGIDAVSYFIREFDFEISHLLSPKHTSSPADPATTGLPR